MQPILNHGGKLEGKEKDCKALLNGTGTHEQMMLSISKESAELILENDIESCLSRLRTRDYFLAGTGQLICLVFQCGLRGVEEKIIKRWENGTSQGQLFISKIKNQVYERAAEILIASFLAGQTPKRTIKLYGIMR